MWAGPCAAPCRARTWLIRTDPAARPMPPTRPLLYESARYTRWVAVIVRRLISLAVVVCCAGAPTALLACAADCVPATVPHSGALATAGPPTPVHHHANHEAASPQLAPGGETATNAATYSPAVSPHAPAVAPAALGADQCAHGSARIGTSTAASRADAAASSSPGLAAASPTCTPPGPMTGRDSTAAARAHHPSLLRAPLVLRI
jgi:hypothetical protein